MPLSSSQVLVRLSRDLSLEKKAIARLLDMTEDKMVILSKTLSDTDLAGKYKQRFKMIVAGAYFMLDRLPKGEFTAITHKQRGALRTYLARLQDEFNSAIDAVSDKSDINQYQRALHEKSCLLVAACAVQLNHGPTDMVRMLSKSEEYVTLLAGNNKAASYISELDARPDLVTISPIEQAGKRYLLIQKEEKLPPLSAALQTELMQIKAEGKFPRWYKSMAPFEQRILRYVLSLADDVSGLNNLFLNYPSRLRTLPGTANFRKHYCQLVECKPDGSYIPIRESIRITSSHIASRDVEIQDVRDYHAQHNLEQIITLQIDTQVTDYLDTHGLPEGETKHIEVPVLVQTLVSPIIAPDSRLTDDKARAIKALAEKRRPMKVMTPAGTEVEITVSGKYISTNHSLNYGRFLSYTSARDESCREYISYINSRLEEKTGKGELSPENKANIRLLLAEYEAILAKDGLLQATWYDVHARELFLSTIEQLLAIQTGCTPHGSCVSAKDRKSLEFIHTDAAELYHQFYGKWPSYSDEGMDRQRFVNLFAKLYITRHHHECAAQNAPGAAGIKTPTMYLPADIQDAILKQFAAGSAKRDYLFEHDDRLASNNELRSIVRGMDWWAASWSYYKSLVVKKLADIMAAMTPGAASPAPGSKSSYSEAELELIQAKLCAIVSNKPYWHRFTSYSVFQPKMFVGGSGRPDGVTEIKNCLLDKHGRLREFTPETIEILSNIAQQHSQSYLVRHPQTKTFYRVLGELFFNQDTDAERSRVLSELDEIYQQVLSFDAKKETAPDVGEKAAAEVRKEEKTPSFFS